MNFLLKPRRHRELESQPWRKDYNQVNCPMAFLAIVNYLVPLTVVHSQHCSSKTKCARLLSSDTR